jgi:hypothetical protein
VARTGILKWRQDGFNAVEISPDIRPQSKIAATAPRAEVRHRGTVCLNYLKARHEVFIDATGRDLPQADGMKLDQYDTPQRRGILIREYGRVLAGMRLTPTTAQCEQNTYILLEAQRGLSRSISNRHPVFRRACPRRGLRGGAPFPVAFGIGHAAADDSDHPASAYGHLSARTGHNCDHRYRVRRFQQFSAAG